MGAPVYSKARTKSFHARPDLIQIHAKLHVMLHTKWIVIDSGTCIPKVNDTTLTQQQYSATLGVLHAVTIKTPRVHCKYSVVLFINLLGEECDTHEWLFLLTGNEHFQRRLDITYRR